MNSENLLSIKNLKTHFTVGESVVKAVDGVSFNLEAGKTFAIVGESGSGKSITALSIMGLLPNNLAQTERGEILFDNKNLIDLEENEIVNHSIYLFRPLHCWEFSFKWWPTGSRQGFLLNIYIKNPDLRDVKLKSTGGSFFGL